MRRTRILAIALAGAIAAAATFSLGHAASLPVGSAKLDSFAANQLAPTTTVQSDTTAPGLTALQMFDTNANGRVDQVVATFNETLASYSAPNSVWTLTNAPGGVGNTVSSVTVAASSATLTLNEADVNTSAGALTTAFKVTLAAHADGIRDAAGNKSSFSDQLVTDKAAPVVTTARYFDTSVPANGIIDQIQVAYSEPLATSTATAPWSFAGGPTGMSSTSTPSDLTGVSTSGSVVTLTISETNSDDTIVTTVAPALTVSLNNASSAIKDLATIPNSAGPLTSYATADAAKPIPTFVELLDKGSGGTDGKPEQGDKAIIRFSEPLDRQTLCGSAAADWAVAGVGVLDDDTQVTVTLTETTGSNTDDTLTVTASGCSAGLRFGTFGLADDGYISATTSFAGSSSNKSTLTWTPGSSEISVLLGARVGSTDATGTVSGNRTVTYNPPPAPMLEDPSGNTVTATKTSANEKQF